MTVSFVVYGVFALVTNILAGRLHNTQVRTYINQISLGSKINNMNLHNNNLYIIQVWLGLLMVVIWMVFFQHKEVRRREVENEQDKKNITASDFTVMIENLPNHYTAESLQQDLDEYYMNVQNHIKFPDPNLYPGDSYNGRFTISRFNTALAYNEVVTAIEEHEASNPLQKELN